MEERRGKGNLTSFLEFYSTEATYIPLEMQKLTVNLSSHGHAAVSAFSLSSSATANLKLREVVCFLVRDCKTYSIVGFKVGIKYYILGKKYYEIICKNF